MNVIDHTYTFKNKLTKRKKTTKIICHCTANPEGQDVTMEAIHNGHLKRGFSGIGYHYIIDRYGNVHVGRPEDTVGAHTEGQNSISIGVCYIGGLENKPNTAYKDLKPKDTRTPEQKIAMYELLYYLLNKYPNATVHGHYEFANKACPSFKMETLQREYHLWLQVKDTITKTLT